MRVQGPFPSPLFLSLSKVEVGRVRDAWSLSLWIIWKRQDCLEHQWLFNRGTSWEIIWEELLYFGWMESTYTGLFKVFATEEGKVLHHSLRIHVFVLSLDIPWSSIQLVLPCAHETSLPGLPLPQLALHCKTLHIELCHWEWCQHPLKERLL